MRLIDADEVERLIDEWLDIVGYCTIGKGLSYYGELLGCIEDAPTIEAAPVVHGEWILEREPDGTPYCYHCSVCDSDFMRINIKTVFPYCPNCGAKMDGKAV